jgi:hypothetical protein
MKKFPVPCLGYPTALQTEEVRIRRGLTNEAWYTDCLRRRDIRLVLARLEHLLVVRALGQVDRHSVRISKCADKERFDLKKFGCSREESDYSRSLWLPVRSCLKVAAAFVGVGYQPPRQPRTQGSKGYTTAVVCSETTKQSNVGATAGLAKIHRNARSAA